MREASITGFVLTCAFVGLVCGLMIVWDEWGRDWLWQLRRA